MEGNLGDGLGEQNLTITHTSIFWDSEVNILTRIMKFFAYLFLLIGFGTLATIVPGNTTVFLLMAGFLILIGTIGVYNGRD